MNVKTEKNWRALTQAETATMSDHSRDPWYPIPHNHSYTNAALGLSSMILAVRFPWEQLEVQYGMVWRDSETLLMCVPSLMRGVCANGRVSGSLGRLPLWKPVRRFWEGTLEFGVDCSVLTIVPWKAFDRKKIRGSTLHSASKILGQC